MANTPGKGSLLKVSISAAYTTIAQQVTFTGPSGSAAQIDTTTLSDTIGKKAVGIPKWGEARVTVNWDPADSTHQYLHTAFTSGSLESIKIVYADPGVADDVFSAYVAGIEEGQAGQDDLIQKTFVFAITGSSTITP